MQDGKLIEKLKKTRKRCMVSRVYRRLLPYGDPDRILQDAVKELTSGTIFQENGLALTPKYLIVFSGRTRAVIPLESALWVFRLQNMRYSFLKDRDVMHYSMRIYTITGDKLILKDRKKEELDRIEALLTDRYPNFFYGYSEEHDRMVRYILTEQAREVKENRRKAR